MTASKKYELIPPDIDGLFRIKALRDFGDVKAGDFGGYIRSEDNLSHDGDCWVYGRARVGGNAKVFGNARVGGNAKVFGNARVGGNAKVFGDALVYGNAEVCGNAAVRGNVKVNRNDICTGRVYTFRLTRDYITITDNHINIGCEHHSLEYWLENYQDIGKANNYTYLDIVIYRIALDMIKMIKEKK